LQWDNRFKIINVTALLLDFLKAFDRIIKRLFRSMASYIGKKIDSVPTPALVVDKEVFKQNCEKLLQITRGNGIQLRPHIKTHKTVEGSIFQTGGTKRCVVTSTLVEAEMLADAGFDDILYGVPYIPAHLERVYILAGRLDKFHQFVASKEACQQLAKATPPPGKKWSLMVKVDCGNARAGVWWEEETVITLAKYIHDQPSLHFHGLYIHCGNSYSAHSVEEVKRVRDATIDMATRLVEKLSSIGVPCPSYGIGSTPSCSHPGQKYDNITEIHPGNYAFYDTQQEGLGSCSRGEIAAVVATRIIGHYPARRQLLVDCGFTGLTKQGKGNQAAHPRMIAAIKGHPQLMLSDMTQEHGFVEPISATASPDYSALPVGSLLYLLPYHSCATAACHPTYYVTDKNGVIVEQWNPCRGW